MNSNKNQKLLSVIIVSFNCLTYLKKCIKSILEFNDIGDLLEIIIVDNSNKNDIIKWLIAVNYKCVKFVKNDNKGFGQANNIGAKLALGKYLCFLNPDTELIEPIFKYAVEKFDSDIKVGCFGFQLLNSFRQKAISCYFRRLPMGVFYRIFAYCVMKFDFFSPRLMYTSGANIFISKEDFFVCGMFDERIFMYFEEPDLCNRLNKLGKYIRLYRDKSIIHYEGKSTSFKNIEKEKKILESYKYYCRKYNMNFIKDLKSDLIFLKFKLFFSYIFNKSKYDYFTKKINLLNKMILD